MSHVLSNFPSFLFFVAFSSSESYIYSQNLRLMIMLIVHDIQWLFSYLYLMFISKMIFTKRHSTHQIKTHFKLLHG